MSEIEPQEIDTMLRRSFAANVPTLSNDFDERLLVEVHRLSRPLDKFGKRMIFGYALIATIVSAVMMSDQGLAAQTILACIAGPLSLTAIGAVVGRAMGQRRS